MGWKSELEIRSFEGTMEQKTSEDSCRVGLVWSLLEMPVGHESMQLKLLV